MVTWFLALGPIEQISLILAVIDVVAGALPNSWLPYKGVMLGVAGVLKDFDVKRKPPAGTKGTIVSVLLCLAMVNCAGFANLPSVCDDLKESVLCDLAAENNIRLEDIGAVLIVANYAAIGQGYYTKEQASAVMTELRDLLKNPVSWTVFKVQVYAQVDAGIIKVADDYFSLLKSYTEMMYNEDRRILIDFLNDQI